jgi:beta-galactosidase
MMNNLRKMGLLLQLISLAGVGASDNRKKFTVKGPGRQVATDNECQIDLDSFQAPEKKAFNGLCLAVIGSTLKMGTIQVSPEAEGLASGSLELRWK